MLATLSDCFRSDLALDLGTATTLLAVPGAGLLLEEPSVVAVAQGTRQVLGGGCAVGHLAKQLWGRAPGNMHVVKPLAGGVIHDFELCEAMLRYYLRKAHRGTWRRRPRILAAVPGGSSPVEKRALFNSALRAGARQVLLMPTAKAAALGIGLPIAEPQAQLIVDVGGGTTEVAVLCLGDIVAWRSLQVAGDQMDETITAHLRRTHGLRIGPATAERLRVRVGSAAPLPVTRSDEVPGVDVTSGLPRRLLVDSEEIRRALAEPLAAIVDAIKDTLDGVTTDMAADLLDNGLTLTGGGSQLAGLDQYLNSQTGLAVRRVPHPERAVVQGLLIGLEHLSEFRAAMESSDDDV